MTTLNKQKLLACDMDGTVIPLEDKTLFHTCIDTLNQQLADHPGICSAYITGRHIDLALDGIAQWHLPLPNYIVTNVGTTVYVNENGVWKEDPAYRDHMSALAGPVTRERVIDLLKDVEGLELQEPALQSEFKISYYFDDRYQADQLFQMIEAMALSSDMPVSVIVSRDEIRQKGLLDILPKGASKQTALEFLCTSYSFQKHQVVYAGDSGNDIEAFLCGCNAIVLENTPEDVKQYVRQVVDGDDEKQRCIYFSKAKYTEGVLEGCVHFGLFNDV